MRLVRKSGRIAVAFIVGSTVGWGCGYDAGGEGSADGGPADVDAFATAMQSGGGTDFLAPVDPTAIEVIDPSTVEVTLDYPDREAVALESVELTDACGTQHELATRVEWEPSSGEVNDDLGCSPPLR